MTVAGIRGNRSHGNNWSDSGNIWELLLLVLTVDDFWWVGMVRKREELTVILQKKKKPQMLQKTKTQTKYQQTVDNPLLSLPNHTQIIFQAVNPFPGEGLEWCGDGEDGVPSPFTVIVLRDLSQAFPQTQ